MSRDLLFRVTRADFDEEHVRGSGPGGQHRNKTATGVRLTHRASGAVGEATDSKSQHINRIEAWKRLRQTPEWERWFREMCRVTMGRRSLDDEIADSMADENITTQIRVNDRWTTVDPKDLT